MSFLKSNKFLILLLVLTGLAVYASTFRNGMFWDDNDFILNNEYIKDWGHIGKFFSENVIAGAGFGSNYWRPALLAVFSIEWHLWGGWSAGYHFVNTAIHIFDGILLFLILLRILVRPLPPSGPSPGLGREGRGRWLAFFVAAFFLVHPVQTEAVSYANSLGDSLSVFFMFSGILLFLKGKRFWPLVFYALALSSKETAIVMPGLLALAVFFSQPPSLTLPARGREALKNIWPYLALAGIYILLRATNLNFQNSFNLYNEENAFTDNIGIRIFTFFRILTVYLGLLIWPAHQHMERTVEIATSFGAPDVLAGTAIFITFLALAVTGIKRWPALSFGIFWFFTGLAPTSNIAVPINGLLYEHWLYLPMIGFFLAFVWLGNEAAKKWNIRKIMTAVFAAWVVFLGGLAIRRNTDWYDPIRFYNQILRYNQRSYRVYNNLGMAYADEGDYDQAVSAYEKAIALDPRVAVAYYNLGNAFRDRGQADTAVEYYKKSFSADPGFTYAASALAAYYLDQKNYAEALPYVKKLLEFHPNDPSLQELYLQLKQTVDNSSAF